MFYGEFKHTVDAKGRIIIPAKFRDALREHSFDKLYVTRGLERCLFVFTPREWNRLIEKFRTQPITNARARDFMRIFISGASEVECDKQGRIMLPPNLIAWAGLRRDVVAAGVLNRFEIWDEESWTRYQSEKGNDYEEIAQSLIDTGL